MPTSRKKPLSPLVRKAFVSGKGLKPSTPRTNPIEVLNLWAAENLASNCRSQPAPPCDIMPKAQNAPIPLKDAAKPPIQIQYDYEKTAASEEVLSCLAELHAQFPRYWENKNLFVRRLLMLALKVDDEKKSHAPE